MILLSNVLKTSFIQEIWFFCYLANFQLFTSHLLQFNKNYIFWQIITNTSFLHTFCTRFLGYSKIDLSYFNEMRSKMKFSQKNDNHMPKYVIGSKIVVKSLKISVHVYTKYRFIGYSKIDVIIFQCIQKLSFHKNDNNMPKYVILVNFKEIWGKSWKIPEYQSFFTLYQISWIFKNWVCHTYFNEMLSKMTFSQKMVIICQNMSFWVIWSKFEVKSWIIAEYKKTDFLNIQKLILLYLNEIR